MRFGRWSAVALVMAMLPVPAATQGTADAVSAWPSEGDTARYQTWGPVDHWETGIDPPEDVGLVAWTMADQRLWDGADRAFMALRHEWQSHRYGEDPFGYQGIGTETALYHTLPGGRFAEARQLFLTDAQTDVIGRLDADARDVTFDGEPCAGHPAALVVGLASDDATRALTECARIDPRFPGPVETSWEEHARFGLTFVARFGAANDPDAPATAHGLLLRFSPATSMPVEIIETGVGLGGEDLDGEVRGTWMTGWRAGEDPLPRQVHDVPDVPRLPLVPWGPNGPADDLEAFPVQATRQALESEADGRTWFDTYANARIQGVRYWEHWQDLSAYDPYRPPLTAATGPLACIDSTAAAGPSTKVHGMATIWTVQAARFHGFTFSHPDAAGLQQVVADPERSDRGDGYDTAPTWPAVDLGPAWHDVMAAETYVSKLGGEGRLAISIHDPAMTGDWQSRPFYKPQEQFSHIRLHAPLGGTHMSASIARYDCHLDDGRTVHNEDGVHFIDGVLRYQWSIRSGVTSVLLREAGLATPPVFGSDEPGLIDEGLPIIGAVTFAAAALALLALLVKWLLPLFTRVQPGQALGHPARADLMAAIEADPGIALPALAERLDMHRDRAAHHVRMLERLDKVRVTRTWRGLVLHPSGHAEAAQARVLVRAHAEKLLANVHRSPGVGVSQAADTLGVPKSRVSVLARDLEEAGLLERRREGRTVGLYPVGRPARPWRTK